MATPILNASHYEITEQGIVLKQDRARVKHWFKSLAAILLFATVIFSPILDTGNFVSVDKIGYESVPESTAVENVIQEHIQKVNSKVGEDDARTMASSLTKWAEHFQLPVSLLVAVAQEESYFDKHAISSVGAMGLLQVLPKWHIGKLIKAREELGTPEPFDIDTNVFVGAWILRDCKTKYKTTEKA